MSVKTVDGGLNNITPHRPNFIESESKSSFDFSSTAEMLAMPWVKNFSGDATFYQYSICENMLMAEYRYGEVWYVVGFIKHPEHVELPKWTGGEP